MKIYVVAYKPRKEYEEAVRRAEMVSSEDAYDIYYNVEPHWTLPDKAMAETELRILLPMRVHVGHHYCQLEVEQLGEDKFAIVCNGHPEIQRTERLQEFEVAFAAIETALHESARQCTFAHAENVAESFGLLEQGDGKPSARSVWKKTDGDLTLWFQWYFYDQSHPFSIQPDMNKLRLELRRGDNVLRTAESSYED